MALTFSRDTPRGGMPVGNMKLVIGQLTFDGAYPVKVSHAGGAPADIDVNTESKALSEVPDGANLSDVTITVMVWGY